MREDRMARVTKISIFEYVKDEEEGVETPIESEHSYYKEIPKKLPALDKRSMSLNILIEIAYQDIIIKRREYLQLRLKEFKLISLDKKNFTAKYSIFKDQFDSELLEIMKDIRTNFCMTEHELVQHAFDFIKAKTKSQHFRTQVEIDGCIIDGLAFVSENEGKLNHSAKIIGFEIKTNKDNYKRLTGQINAYLSICDEVYLVIEDKKPPVDLPFYVGVLKSENATCKLIRHAQTLKHSISPHELWNCLLKSTAQKCCPGMNMEDLLDFFNAIETIKRKLIWNQFVIGFHQTYVKEYIQLTDREKSIVKHFFEFDNIIKPIEKQQPLA
jgi:hypothetical protein